MTKQSSDGWHNFYGYEVYVEDGCIQRGIGYDHNRHEITRYPYRKCPDSGWGTDIGLTVEAFRAGVRRGTIKMF